MPTYTMLIVATIDAPNKQAAEEAMVAATPGVPAFGGLTSVVAEGDWSMLLPQNSMEFMIEATHEEGETE